MTKQRSRPCLPSVALTLACVVALSAAGWTVPSRAAAANGPFAAASGGFAEFDRSMLAGGGKMATDLARFEHGNPVLPGIYNVDITVNEHWVARMDVRFAAPQPDASAVPCVTQDLLDRMGLVPVKSAAAAIARLKDTSACVQLAKLIPDASFNFDQGKLQLDAGIPQAYLSQLPRGYVNPASWDAGIPAFLLNYNLNSYRTTSGDQQQTSTYLGLRSGLNIGHWLLRQDSTITWQSGSAGVPARRHWQNIDTYAQRALPSLRANLILGDSFTDGAVFDSFGIRGVQLVSSDQMLPQSQRGYAPVIHGMADSNAKVAVFQNGIQIYQTTVAPGPFTINDLYPTGFGGSLVVTVTEADGRQHSFSVPYASVAQLQRAGITRFDVTVGQLRDNNLHTRPGVFVAAAQRGFSNFFTGYAGVQAATGYASALVGGAFNTRFGALALDLTQAHAEIPGYGSHNGQSFRITYSKIIPATNTSLTVAAYRYSTSGFMSLQNAEYARDYVSRGLAPLQYIPSGLPMVDGVSDTNLLTPAQRAALAGTSYNGTNAYLPQGLLQQKDRFTLSLSQHVGQIGGSLYANVSMSDYWNQHDRDTQVQLGYNNHLRRLNYSISASRSRLPNGAYDNQVFVNASIPLGASSHAPNLSLNFSHDDQTGSQQQAMLSGSAGRWNQFTYGATASHGDGAIGNTISANAGYSSPYAVFNASAGTGNGYSQQSVNISGALVAFQGGVVFGQPTGDTVAIVHAPDADGTRITNAPNAQVNRSGYGLVPHLTPYQLNTIQLDPQDLPLGVQLDATSTQVVPYQGAVVMANFKSQAGAPLIVSIRMPDGKPAPFGIEVHDAQGNTVGTVGQDGQALLSVHAHSGVLTLQQDQGANTCHFKYQITNRDKKAAASLQLIHAHCTTP